MNLDSQTNQKIQKFIRDNLKSFQENRIRRYENLSLNKLLKRKNPYLFKAKNIEKALELIEAIISASSSSGEETVFGEFLENLAIFICELFYGGRKSSAQGIDLEFERGGVYYLVSIKSGPNWANADQKRKLFENFNKAKKALSSNAQRRHIEFINGCCYGQDNKYELGYRKSCGQEFWELISGRNEFYIEFIEPLTDESKKFKDKIEDLHNKAVNLLSKEFLEQFCFQDGRIDWIRVVEFSSKKRHD